MKITALTYLLSLKPEVVSHERSMEISECLVQSVQSSTDWSIIEQRAEGCFFLLIHVKDEEIPNVIRTLLEKNIQVYRVYEERKTLEEQFLELTGGKDIV